jgi:hypothetical protein
MIWTNHDHPINSNGVITKDVKYENFENFETNGSEIETIKLKQIRDITGPTTSK